MGRLCMPLAAHHSFMTSRQSGRSMAAPAILAKGSHEGILILDGTNRVAVDTVATACGDVSAIEVQDVGIVGIEGCR